MIGETSSKEGVRRSFLRDDRDAIDDVGEISVRVDAAHLGGLCRPPNYAERLFRLWRYEALCPPFRSRTGR